MNEKSNTEKTAFGMTKEEFGQIKEVQERLSKGNFEDKALEQFVKEPEKSNLDDKVMSTMDFIGLFILFCVMFVFSFASIINEKMEKYVYGPIAFLSIIGIIILLKDTRKNDKRNNKNK